MWKAVYATFREARGALIYVKSKFRLMDRAIVGGFWLHIAAVDKTQSTMLSRILQRKPIPCEPKAVFLAACAQRGAHPHESPWRLEQGVGLAIFRLRGAPQAPPTAVAGPRVEIPRPGLAPAVPAKGWQPEPPRRPPSDQGHGRMCGAAMGGGPTPLPPCLRPRLPAPPAPPPL